MTFTGPHCQTPVLPACVLDDGFAIPIRSWVLHAFHDGAGKGRWRDGGETRAIGPVPCACLQQLVSTPFFLERTRLQFMRGFVARCVDLPSNMTLRQFIEVPDAPEMRRSWRRFSFAAAHDALRLGAEPALRGAPLDPQNPELGEQVQQLLKLRATDKAAFFASCPRGACLSGVNVDVLQPTIPPLLLPRRATPLPLAPLSACVGGCGGKGWCEWIRTDHATSRRVPRGGVDATAAVGAARCGCFVPKGLSQAWGAPWASEQAGGPNCMDLRPWRTDTQPPAHWGPPCLLNCSGRGLCDWQGFCQCDSGYWGIDCALTRGPDGGAIVDAPLIELLPTDADPYPLTPLHELVRPTRAVPPASGSARGAGRQLLYVVDTPPLLRFGVDFAGHVELSLTERMLRSVHRAPTVARASFLWYPGAPLVIDGHRLLARLWHAVHYWLDAGPSSEGLSSLGDERRAGANVAGASRRALLVLMPLLTERASMDSFQLSYSDNDREEWPALVHSAPTSKILRMSPECGVASADTSGGVIQMAPRDGKPTLSGEVGRSPLAVQLIERKKRLGRATLLGLFAGGGYDSFRSARYRGCRLPSQWLPWSANRFWGGLQFSGNPSAPVFFQRGKDLVIPQMLLLSGGGSHADQPSCEQMATSSPFSPRFSRAELHRNRSTLLWFGGHSGHGDARTAIFRLHANRRGFVLVDALRSPARRRDAINMSLSSAFCWVPRGQGQGDPTRHMVAIFHGCVPVFTLGKSENDDALPFEEILPWRRFSLRVPVDELRSLPNVVRAAARDQAQLKAMQMELGCVWRALFWTSLKGSCFGERLSGDAFDAFIQVLERRRAMQADAADVPRADGLSACTRPLLSLPTHLRDADGAPMRDRLAAGSTWTPGRNRDADGGMVRLRH